MPSGLTALREAVSWVHVLVALAGVVVCAMNLGRSRWTWVLLAGFGVDAFVSAAYRVSSLMMGRGTLSYQQLDALFLMLSLLGVAGSAAIVGGLALLLREVSGARPAAGGAGSADRP